MFSDEFSLYNIGITGGYTHHMPRLKWRSSISLYRVFNIKTDPEARIFPEGFSVGASSGLYMPVKLSRRITLLPNGTLYAGTGKAQIPNGDRKSTRLNSSHVAISYGVFCLKK